jgi:hypothetical protein
MNMKRGLSDEANRKGEREKRKGIVKFYMHL